MKRGIAFLERFVAREGNNSTTLNPLYRQMQIQIRESRNCLSWFERSGGEKAMTELETMPSLPGTNNVSREARSAEP